MQEVAVFHMRMRAFDRDEFVVVVIVAILVIRLLWS